MKFGTVHAVLAVLIVITAGCSAPLGPAAGGLVTRIAQRARALGGQLFPAAGVTYATADSPSTAWVSVSAAAACRSGPGPTYATILTAAPGTRYQVLGSDTPDNYWIITDQAGQICWLSKQGALVIGSAVGMPEFTIDSAPAMPTATAIPTATPTGPTPTPAPPPTVTPTRLPRVTATPPLAPNGLRGSRTCTSGSQNGTPVWVESITLNWGTTHGELGFTVYENGSPIAQLAQNSAYYQLQLQYDQGAGTPTPDTFAIQAFNRGGTSPQLTVSIPRCP